MEKKSDSKVQRTIDGIIDKMFLWAIPKSVKPNYVTIVRFILVPIVYLLLVSGNTGLGLVVFVIAASTDFIDGAMARTRNQITDVGKIIDPVADKLLIIAVLLYIGFKYLIVQIFVVFIVLELIAVLLGAFLSFTIGRTIGANVFGKIKMILQSFSVGLFVLGIAVKNSTLIDISGDILFVALFFAILAGIENLRLKINNFRSSKA